MADLLLVLGWIIAALMVGLWWGERGRRRAAERWAVTGSPDDAAPAATSRVPAREAEDRFQESVAAAQKETVGRMYEDESARLKAEGISFDPKQLRKDIEFMVETSESVLE